MLEGQFLVRAVDVPGTGGYGNAQRLVAILDWFFECRSHGGGM